MITLSDTKIESLLSLTGNNNCIECGKNTVDWVSFPTTVFLCSSCCRLHKNFSKKEILKSITINEFTEREVSKMNIGGNARYLTLLNEYKISVEQPNIENKYLTVITRYYNTLLEAEVRKIKQLPGSETIYEKLLLEKPKIERGGLLATEEDNFFIESVQESRSNNDLTSFGEIFSYLGGQISNAAEQMGINKVYNDAKNNIDTALTDYGIKDTVNKTVGYAKIAGGYIVDKGKEIASTPMVQGVVNSVSEGINVAKEQASNMIGNITGNDGINQQQPQQVQENLNNNNNNQNVYQQLNNDQI